MTGIDRRTAALIAMLTPFAGRQAFAAGAGQPMARPPEEPQAVPANWVRPDMIAMLVYPGMTALDLFGPQHMFAALMGAKVHLVAKAVTPVTSDMGVTIMPTTSFADCPRDLTVLFVPGGTTGTLAAADDDATRAFVADRGARARYVTSVCTGSLILGAAGLLKGYRATAHWSVREVLADFGAVPVDARVVRDRNRITGGGVTAGIDFGLSMVAELRDAHYARCTQLVAEYDPHPPFDAGSVHRAPPEVRASMTAMFAPFVSEARALARRRG